jgi:hypothetical protein
MDDWESKFAEASRYVERGKSIVARQRERVEQLIALRASTEEAEDVLALFLGTLTAPEDHQQLVLDKANRNFLGDSVSQAGAPPVRVH